jgi:uncharacterized protein YxjI
MSAFLASLGNIFLVKEHVGLFRAASNYDIFDPATQQQVLVCREPKLGWLTKLFRFTEYKRNTPFAVEVRDPSGALVLQVGRGISLFLSVVEVKDGGGKPLGRFEQRLLSIGGAFDVKGPNGEAICSLEGKWTGWDFHFVREGQQIARVTKKWSGIGKELLTSADSYVLQIAPTLAANDPARPLILAAVLCIDLVLKE